MFSSFLCHFWICCTILQSQERLDWKHWDSVSLICWVPSCQVKYIEATSSFCHSMQKGAVCWQEEGAGWWSYLGAQCQGMELGDCSLCCQDMLQYTQILVQGYMTHKHRWQRWRLSGTSPQVRVTLFLVWLCLEDRSLLKDDVEGWQKLNCIWRCFHLISSHEEQSPNWLVFIKKTQNKCAILDSNDWNSPSTFLPVLFTMNILLHNYASSVLDTTALILFMF